MQQFDLSTQRHIHVVGIGGAGMNAIATVLLGMGHVVTGSDAKDSPVLDRLRTLGATVWTNDARLHLPDDVEALVKSTAVPSTDVEVAEAANRGLPVLHRADMLGSIAATRRTIAIAGTHGKTTTSTMTALVMEAGGAKPSWVIGGEILGRDGGARWDTGAFFVVEADESDGTFVELAAPCVVVTNVEPDHLEFYGNINDRDGAIANLNAHFDKFVAQAAGPHVICVDDEGSAALAARHDNIVTYGTTEGADYLITDVELDRFVAHFNVMHHGESTAIVLPTAGLHNVRNATAALAIGNELDVPVSVGAVGLGNYGGVARRFQRRGEKNGVVFVDEYAHLPGEVEQALAAARAGNWDRIVAVFQPHRYSRTEQVGGDFGGAFDDADVLVLADVFGAGEPVRPGITGHLVENAVLAQDGHPPITYVEARALLAKEVAAMLQPGDLVLTLGAGDITKLSDEIMEVM